MHQSDPAGRPAASPELAAPAARLRRVLVVDDYKQTARTMASLLRTMGHEACTAHDGLEAIETAKSFRPDVVLLDIGLPKLNGYEAARRIRADLGNEVILIALTGWAQAEDERRARDAGFNHLVVKPIKVEFLEGLLGRHESTAKEPRADQPKSGGSQ